MDKTLQEFEEFKKHLSDRRCMICGKSTAYFNENEPCLHWLLRPKGFKKKHFDILSKSFSFARISAYTRWAATCERPLKNINDIKSEHPKNNVIDFTCSYKHITWSFSCSKSDFEGHKGRKEGVNPHYHFQMQLSGMPFINFNDFHPEFHSTDIDFLKKVREEPDRYNYHYGPAIGFQDLVEDKELLKSFVERSRTAEPGDEIIAGMQSMIEAPPGKRISTEQIVEAAKHMEKTGRSMASVAPQFFKDSRVSTIVSPADDTIDAKPRTPTRKKK